jgi:hypothetical protein
MKDYILAMELSSGLLILLYAMTLCKVILGSRHKMLIQLLIMLALNNIGVIADCEINRIIVRHNNEGSPTSKQVDLGQFLSTQVRDISFNLAHWLFAFEYYAISKLIPFVLQHRSLPEGMLVQQRLLFWAVFALNITTPFLEGLTTYEYNLYYTAQGVTSSFWGLLMSLAKFAVGLCQIISAAFLGIAIYKISKMLS